MRWAMCSFVWQICVALNCVSKNDRHILEFENHMRWPLRLLFCGSCVGSYLEIVHETTR